MEYVIGIDAGGTKTLCLLADEHGTVVAEGWGPGANLSTAGELAVEKTLHQVMEAAIGDRDVVPSATILDEVGPIEGLGRLITTLEPGMAESPGLAAACIEFAVEGLWLTRRIDKDDIGGVTRYGAS